MKLLIETLNSKLYVKGNMVYKFPKQFIREALICRMIGDHPYMVRYGVDIVNMRDGQLAIKSNLYPCSLDQLMANGVVGDVWKRVLSQIGSALAYLHSLGILHRDIKPANILCTSKKLSETDFMLADFGSAVVKRAEGHLNTEIDSSSYSSPSYLVDEDRDWWSLGLILKNLGSRTEPDSIEKWSWPVPLQTSYSAIRYAEVDEYLNGVMDFDQLEQVRSFMNRGYMVCQKIPILFKIAIEFYTCMDVPQIKCDNLELAKILILL